jgi:hypothetical protein
MTNNLGRLQLMSSSCFDAVDLILEYVVLIVNLLLLQLISQDALFVRRTRVRFQEKILTCDVMTNICQSLFVLSI